MIEKWATFTDRYGGELDILRESIKQFYADCIIVSTERSGGARGQGTLFGTTIVTDNGATYFVIDPISDVRDTIRALE